MSQKTYTVNKHRQLVDLNGDSKNFDLTFTCTSKGGAPFEVLVVDQATLDSTPTLQYKKANGTISGNIVADKNVYQNYFLVLKADSPCEVTVKIVKKDINPSLPPTSQPRRPPVPTQRPSLKPPTRPRKSNWKIIALVLVVLGGGALLYYFYSQNKKTKSSGAPVAVDTPDVPPSPSPSVTSSSGGGLLDRLKSLDMSK